MIEYDNTRFDPMIIISSNLSDNDVEKLLASADIAFKRVRGSYEGVEETSWIIRDRDLSAVQILTIQFVTEGQKTILYLFPQEARKGGRRKAQMIYLSKSPDSPERSEMLGWWTAANESEARSRDGWTHDPVSGWWIIEPFDHDERVNRDAETSCGKYEDQPGNDGREWNWIA